MTVRSVDRRPRRWQRYVGYGLLALLSVVGAFIVYVAVVFIGR